MKRFFLTLLLIAFVIGFSFGNVATAVILTFDNVVGGNATAIVNTDGSLYFNENFKDAAGSNPVPVSGAGQSTLGNGSWEASAVGQLNHLTVYGLDSGGGGINEGAFTGFGAGGAEIRIRDIESFSFDTNQPAGSSLADWNVTIYTKPDSIDDDAGWYGKRILFEPAYAYNFSGPKDTWNTWSTDAGTNQLGMLDKAPGTASTSGGFSGGPTLLDVQGGIVNWDPTSESGFWPSSGESKGVTSSVASLDYRDEVINFIRINIGSPNNHPMLLDNFNFTLKSSFDVGVDSDLVLGQSVTIDFEDPNFVASTPEPTSIVLLVSGLLGMRVLRRRRRRKV